MRVTRFGLLLARVVAVGRRINFFAPIVLVLTRLAASLTGKDGKDRGGLRIKDLAVTLSEGG